MCVCILVKLVNELVIYDWLVRSRLGYCVARRVLIPVIWVLSLCEFVQLVYCHEITTNTHNSAPRSLSLSHHHARDKKCFDCDQSNYSSHIAFFNTDELECWTLLTLTVTFGTDFQHIVPNLVKIGVVLRKKWQRAASATNEPTNQLTGVMTVVSLPPGWVELFSLLTELSCFHWYKMHSCDTV